MIGLPHKPAETDTPSLSFIVAMDSREGRIGNAFACERCRKHKVRCVPSDRAGICQRCDKARVDCEAHVARRRPAKSRIAGQTPIRVTEMEKKLDKLSAIVTATPVPSTVPQPILPPVNTVPSQNVEAAQPAPTPTLLQAPALPLVPKPALLPNPGSTPESASSFWDSLNDGVAGLSRLDPVIRSISVIHMQLLTDSYRSMVDMFPFVPLPRDALCRDLLQQRPLLMLAVMTVASYDSALLQLSLSREFRKVATVKIMTGEKSLDLLQSLLVYVAWHHHYMDTHATSIQILLQICTGLILDLGLDKIPQSRGSPSHHTTLREYEEKRAYLGCYYLETHLRAMKLSKARGLSYSAAVQSYAAELTGHWEHRTDAQIPAIMSTCQYVEDLDETFRESQMYAAVAKSQAKRLGTEWDDLYRHTAAQKSGSPILQWWQLSTRLLLYHAVGSCAMQDRDKVSWAPGFQLAQRVQCVRYIEEFLDNSLQLSSGTYDTLSIVEWSALISSLATLAKLVLNAAPIPGWDPSELQIAKIFEYYRDQLCARLPKPRDPQDAHEDVFERFRRMTSIMKIALRSSLSKGSPSGTSFELATGSGRTVSLLQDLPPLESNSTSNGVESLPPLWKVHSQLDVNSADFMQNFLSGTV